VASFQDRVIGAMRLRAATFEDVEHDASATSQAAIVVVAGAASRGLASISLGVSIFLGGIVAALIGWVIGAAVVWVIGTKLLPSKNTQADIGQVLRAVGFAQAPAILGILTIVPILGWVIAFVLAIWTLAATVIAVRQAFEYDDTLRAVFVCVIAWLVMMVVMMAAAMIGVGASMW
jgi:Yip1 domain